MGRNLNLGNNLNDYKFDQIFFKYNFRIFHIIIIYKVRSINKKCGSLVNRVNVMAKFSVKG